ncbi:unnamed protein product, partial [Discosporangium mesarthrocarpum]
RTHSRAKSGHGISRALTTAGAREAAVGSKEDEKHSSSPEGRVPGTDPPGEEKIPLYSPEIMSLAAAVEAGGELPFTATIRPPTPAETRDGRKGVLVSTKHGRLAVLVDMGEKRVAVIEMPGGRQQTLPESEIATGQSIFVRGETQGPAAIGLLVETIDGGIAVLVNEGGKAALATEGKQGKRKYLPLTMLKDLEGSAALAAGEGGAAGGPTNATELMQQVVASLQWAMPQVDIYVGLLRPFAASLFYVETSSRSSVRGRRLYRHSPPNGGYKVGLWAGNDLDGVRGGSEDRDGS